MGEFFINIIKLFFALLLVPIALACAIVIQGHFDTYHGYADFVLWGILAFLFFHLFIYKFSAVYEFGQKFIAIIFRFLAPMDRFISYLIPFYFTLISVVFYTVTRFWDVAAYQHYFVFFLGFSFAMHIICSAEGLQDQEKMLIKPSYFLWMSLVFIFNILWAVLVLDVLTGQWTFLRFLDATMSSSWDYYKDTFMTVVDWARR